jgi:hypothetical protein
MKIIIFISFVLCFSACTKMDSDTEVVGGFANALCGYEGTISYADGRPAKGYPMQMYVGHPYATIDSATGAIKSDFGLSNLTVNQKSDDKGQFKLLTANKNVNTTVPSGCTPLGGLKFSNFEYFEPALTVNNQSQEHMSVPSVFGQIQKIDVKLHEVSKLHMDSKNIKIDYDNIKIECKYTSPTTGKELNIFHYTDSRVWYLVQKTKPNVPINLTVEFFKSGKPIDTRNVRMAMDKKDNYLEIQ